MAAGDERPVRAALEKLMAMRAFMRAQTFENSADSAGNEPASRALEEAGLTPETAREMYRLLAVARYDERFVIPSVRLEQHENVWKLKGNEGFPEELS